MVFNTSSDIQEISTEELEAKMEADKEAVYIDVREMDEFAAGHIEGMTNMPLSAFANEYTELPKDKEIVLICRSGNRSMQAATFLQEQGYKNITNVSGGMLAWGGPVITN